MNWDFMDWVMAMLMALIFGLLAFVVYVVWQGATAETFELVKAEWHCTDERSETHLRPMLVGKVMVMLPITQKVCDRWERRK